MNTAVNGVTERYCTVYSNTINAWTGAQSPISGKRKETWRMPSSSRDDLKPINRPPTPGPETMGGISPPSEAEYHPALEQELLHVGLS